MQRILTTGTSKGLGRYLNEQFGGYAFTRSTTNEEYEAFKAEGFDVIIHAAYNPTKDVTSKNAASYMQDTILLTKKILDIPHKKVFFISTIDVYPKGAEKHTEEEVLRLDTAKDVYAFTKLICESLVQEDNKDNVVLRCSAMLGEHMRKNSIKRIIDEQNPQLTLSGQSDFNYILYSQIRDVIEHMNKQNLGGVFNVVSSQNITLNQIAEKFKKEVRFGNFIYQTGSVDNQKICAVYPQLDMTSQEVIDKFVLESNGKQNKQYNKT